MYHPSPDSSPEFPDSPDSIEPVQPPVDELVALAQNGDVEAFGALLDATDPIMRSVIVKSGAHPNDFDDIAQIAKVRISNGLPAFRREASFATWAATVTRNVKNSWYSTVRFKKEQLHTPEDMGEMPEVEAVEAQNDPANHVGIMPDIAGSKEIDAQALWALVKGLSEKEREVLVLRDVYDLSHEQIMARLGISESVSKVRLHRARQHLKESLQTEKVTTSSFNAQPIFDSIMTVAERKGFTETYLLLPTSYHDTLNWFMATGDLEQTAAHAGVPVEECRRILETAEVLLARGTKDYKQYTVGGESKLASPLSALEIYPGMKTILAAGNIPDDAVRLLKEKIAQENVYTQPDGTIEQHRHAIIDKTVRFVGRTALQGIKFEERFPVQWLKEVIAEPEYQKYFADLPPKQHAILKAVVKIGNLQDAARFTKTDLFEFWNGYRTGVHHIAEARLQEWRKIRREYPYGINRQLRIRSPHNFAIFANQKEFDQNAQYAFMAGGLFNKPPQEIAEVLGVSTSEVLQMQEQVEKRLPDAQKLHKLGYKVME